MNETMIIRTKKTRDYTMISNKFLKDDRLSWKAKGILCYILSLPDDWHLRESELRTHATDGRDSFASGMNELIKLGYIRREQLRENGKFTSVRYFVYESPEDPDLLFPELPLTENQLTENPSLLITNNTNTNNTKNKLFKNNLFAEPEGSAERSSERRLTKQQYIKVIEKVPLELRRYITKESDDSYVISSTFNENYKNWLLWNNPLDLILEDSENEKTKALEDCSRNPLRGTVSGRGEVENKKSTNYSTEGKKVSPELFSNLGMVKASEYVPDHNPPKKTKKTSKPKEDSDSQKVKAHYLENRNKLFEAGKVPTPVASVRSPVINKRIKDIFDQGITLEQFCKVLDYAMTQDFVVDTLHYELQPMLSDSVFMKMYSSPDCNAVEKPEVVEHKPGKMIPKCPKCGERLNGFGRCSWCDE